MRDIKILQSLPGHLQSTEGYKWKVRPRRVGKSAQQTLEQGMGCSRDWRPRLLFLLLLLFLAPGKFLHSPKHSGWNILLSSCQNKCAHDPPEGFFSWIHLPGMFTRERDLFCLISLFQAGCSMWENNFQTGYSQCAEAPVTLKYILASGSCRCQACAAALGDQLRCWLWKLEHIKNKDPERAQSAEPAAESLMSKYLCYT